MKKIVDMFLNKQFIIFVIIGVINTFNSTILAMLCSVVIPNVNISFVIGYVLSLGIAYLLNSLFTFKEKLKLDKFIKFAISYIPNFIIQNIIVILCYNILNWHKLIAYALAAIIGVPVTFIILKIFAFKKNDR